MPANLYRTSSGWLYRKVIPADCRQLFGKREVKVSLGADLRTARTKAAALELETLTQIEAIRERLAEYAWAASVRQQGGDPVAMRRVKITRVTDELVEQLRSYWFIQLEEDARERAAGLTPQQWEDREASLQNEHKHLKMSIALGGG